jgi:hypothetical protein
MTSGSQGHCTLLQDKGLVNGGLLRLFVKKRRILIDSGVPSKRGFFKFFLNGAVQVHL